MYLFFLFLAVFPLFAQEQLVDIGEARKIFLMCQGEGSPTVILISGRSDSSDIWRPISFEVAKFTKVCAYDRPGTMSISEDVVKVGLSTSVSQPVTAEKGVIDLHKVLLEAKLSPPFILVAHSYGGLIARLYASRFPNEVVGMVLVDTLTEQLYFALNPEEQKNWLILNSNYSPDLDKYTVQERTDFIPSFEQLKHAPPLWNLPVIVLTADQSFNFKDLIKKGLLPPDTPLNFENTVFQAHLSGQRQLATILKAKHITQTNSGHYIQTEQPHFVIHAIRDVVEQVKSIR